MDEGSLGVHEIEFMINSGEDLSDGSGVGDHADGSHDLGEVATGDNGGRLVVDTALEAGGAPVDEANGALALDGLHGGVHVSGRDVTAVEQTARHVLAVYGVALDLRQATEGREPWSAAET